MQWLLVIVFFSGGNTSLHTERFTSQVACEAAGTAAATLLNARSGSGTGKFSCTSLPQ